MNEAEDDEVAKLYQKMLKGDQNASKQLHKLSNSPLKKSSRHSQNGNIAAPGDMSTHSNIDISKSRKNQNFKNYLRQKVTELRNVKEGSKKQLHKIQTENKKQYTEPKPFAKHSKRPQIRSQQKNSLKEGNNRQGIILEPVGDKTKTTSYNFKQKMVKNVVRDGVGQMQRKSTPPSSNHSFRIRAQGGQKKLLQQLMRINQEERRMQSQILRYHVQTKQQIAQVLAKYNIKQLANQISNISRQKQRNLQSIDSPTIEKVKHKSQYISVQQSKISRLYHQIDYLSRQIESSKNEIAKKQAKIENLALYTYMNAVPDIFEQRQSEQENEQIAELPNVERRMDPSKTYQSVMVEMRRKNWGLQQRFNYETEIARNADSRVNGMQKSPPKDQKGEPDDGENKIVVNSRLKQFLFE